LADAGLALVTTLPEYEGTLFVVGLEAGNTDISEFASLFA